MSKTPPPTPVDPTWLRKRPSFTGQILAWIAVAVAVVAIVAVAINVRQDQQRRQQEIQYQQCLEEERARIDEEGSLLEPEDFCDIHPGRP